MSQPLPDDAIAVNCAQCGQVLLAVKHPRVPDTFPRLRGRVKGRPFCSACLRSPSSGVSGLAGGNAGTNKGDDGPWNENATRAREDGL